jgi:predicted metal-dependent HD superfamily phosphohydrolase
MADTIRPHGSGTDRPHPYAAAVTAWRALAAGLGADAAPGNVAAADAVLANLVDRYGEPGRAYHTLRHVVDVLATIDLLLAAGEIAQDECALRLAAWFHDAVYDPATDDNEARSAELAQASLARLGLPAPRVRSVAELVRATAGHAVSPEFSDSRLLNDADLAVLGAPADEYRRYASAIRCEYRFVPDQRYRQGRIAFLDGMLARPAIYATGVMRKRAEARARANLAGERARLLAGEEAGR